LYYAFTLCARNLPAKLEIYGLATLKLLTGSERYSDLLGFKNESIATQQLRKEGKGSITQARHLRPCNVKIAEWWTRFLSQLLLFSICGQIRKCFRKNQAASTLGMCKKRAVPQK